ncbi:MAG: hypothetical protein CGU28_06805 [Candidatus Dactylopiibacterium carminicum]|uniref:MoaD/ThiS family protein n=1 Tax=Candidatus Dactylopiibacterium carminicum TaxID=857335 RepID=UPI000BA9EECE|nr:MoaD/ThiS family protein [Candidatus Dactylopiibacterium carminicum]PAS96952.1 MAG: hypothetical protein CGU28_06805 [Candidatus Dactylopiibacterium carminicum]PAT00282.1 MAG: hypothetical protein BSR46_03445 [Candidatus Dactylopiibacterium carminicum]
MINVLLFGPVADAAGLRGFTLEHRPGLRVADVLALMAERQPEARRLVTVVALDGERMTPAAQAGCELPADCELVFMAMFSGG